ncbi:glycosyl transferase family 2, partial [Listeria monocytogenes]|nr:glycosyl transferase family 2 [Listeria monocytogenes]
SLAGSTFSKDLLQRVANEMKQEVFELTSFNYYCYHLAEKIGHLGAEASYSLSLADLNDSVTRLLDIKDNHYRKDWT